MSRLSRILLLITALLLSFASPSYAEDEAVVECPDDKNACFAIEGRPDIIIEGLTLLLPDVVGGILDPNKGSVIETNLGAAIGSVTGQVSEKIVKPIIESVGSEIDYTVHDIYFGEGAVFRPVAHEDGLVNTPLAMFEKLLQLFLSLTGAIAALLILVVTVVRVIKLGFGMDRDGTILRNLVTQTPLFFLMGLCLWPISSGMPIFSIVILAGFILGAFIASQFGYLFVVFFADYLLDSREELSPVFRDDLVDMVAQNLMYEADMASSTISQNLFSMDRSFFQRHSVELSTKLPSTSGLKDLFESDELKDLVEKCFVGYWHLNQHFSGCDSLFVNFSSHEGGTTFSSDASTVYTTDSEVAIGDNDSLLTAIVSKLVADSAFSKVIDVDGFKDEFEEYVRGVVRVSFSKMKARKELHCMDSSSISRESTYEKDWACAQFDFASSQFDGVYAQSVMTAKDNGDDETAKEAIRYLSNKVNSQSWGVVAGGEVYELSHSLASAIVESIIPQSGGGDLKVVISGSNAVSLAYDSVLKVSLIEGMRREDGNSHLESISNFLGLVRSKMESTLATRMDVKFDGDDAGVEEERYLRVYAQKVGHYEVYERHSLSTIAASLKQGEPLLLYVDGFVRELPLLYFGGALFGALESHVASSDKYGGHYRDNKGKYEITSKLLKIAFSVCLLFLIFGFVSFLYSYVSLILSAFVRLLTHLMFVPIFVVRFAIDKNDEEDDDDNVFFPSTLKKILERSWVDVLAAMVSFVIALCLMSLLFTMLTDLVHYFMIEVTKGAILEFLFEKDSMQANVVMMGINALIAGWLLIKGNKTIDYMYSKVTQFIEDPAGKGAQAGEDDEGLNEIFSQIKGVFGRK